MHYTLDFELWLHPEGRSGCFDVHSLHLSALAFSRMTRLIRSHSQLNVPSANISTFLRLKSIAIIFLRPSLVHARTHTRAKTRTHASVRSSLFQQPFNLIAVCVSAAFEQLVLNVHFSKNKNNTPVPGCTPHVLLIFSSLN